MSRHVTADRIKIGWLFKWPGTDKKCLRVYSLPAHNGEFYTCSVIHTKSKLDPRRDNYHLRTIEDLATRFRRLARKERTAIQQYIKDNTI